MNWGMFLVEIKWVEDFIRLVSDKDGRVCGWEWRISFEKFIYFFQRKISLKFCFTWSVMCKVILCQVERYHWFEWRPSQTHGFYWLPIAYLPRLGVSESMGFFLVRTLNCQNKNVEVITKLPGTRSLQIGSGFPTKPVLFLFFFSPSLSPSFFLLII